MVDKSLAHLRVVTSELEAVLHLPILANTEYVRLVSIVSAPNYSLAVREALHVIDGLNGCVPLEPALGPRVHGERHDTADRPLLDLVVVFNRETRIDVII